MATSFKRTPLLNPLAKFGEKSTADTAYWKNLDVQIYSSRSNQILRTLSRFKEVAHSGSFRSDGKLLVAGSDEPVVRLFEPNTRSLLRVFNGHTGPVNVTKFLSDNLRVMSGSNDKTVRVWDIATEKELSIYNEHQDYVRCGVACKSSPDIFLTGSYDHTAKLFDARTGESVLTVEHGHPVESTLLFPSGGIFMTAGLFQWVALLKEAALVPVGSCSPLLSLVFGGREWFSRDAVLQEVFDTSRNPVPGVCPSLFQRAANCAQGVHVYPFTFLLNPIWGGEKYHADIADVSQCFTSTALSRCLCGSPVSTEQTRFLLAETFVRRTGREECVRTLESVRGECRRDGGQLIGGICRQMETLLKTGCPNVEEHVLVSDAHWPVGAMCLDKLDSDTVF
ncbi:hypothetical protein BaRGS_00016090 [Batillaria attramentaria]|uniref:Uncharacterized protein n=1 Tax=Batillaria attramentaria TaxID=370345 RepID=A0ABD0KZF0_9CAEN